MCRLIKFSRDERPEGSGLVSRRIMSLSLNPYPLYYRTAFAFSLILYPHRLRRPHGLLTLAGAIRAYPVSLGRPSREGPLSTPAALLPMTEESKAPVPAAIRPISIFSLLDGSRRLQEFTCVDRSC